MDDTRHHTFGVHPHWNDPAPGANSDKVILQEEGCFVFTTISSSFFLTRAANARFALRISASSRDALSRMVPSSSKVAERGSRMSLNATGNGSIRLRYGRSCRGTSCRASSASEPSTGINASRSSVARMAPSGRTCSNSGRISLKRLMRSAIS